MRMYYSVDNCGDGSAYPIFFKHERLAEIHQESLVETYERIGWGEDCTGHFDIGGEFLSSYMTAGELLEQFKDYVEDVNSPGSNPGYYKVSDRLEEMIAELEELEKQGL